jgi:hypothetical protein
MTPARFCNMRGANRGGLHFIFSVQLACSSGHQEQEQGALSLVSRRRAFRFATLHDGGARRVGHSPIPSPATLGKHHVEHQVPKLR